MHKKLFMLKHIFVNQGNTFNKKKIIDVIS